MTLRRSHRLVRRNVLISWDTCRRRDAQLWGGVRCNLIIVGAWVCYVLWLLYLCTVIRLRLRCCVQVVYLLGLPRFHCYLGDDESVVWVISPLLHISWGLCVDFHELFLLATFPLVCAAYLFSFSVEGLQVDLSGVSAFFRAAFCLSQTLGNKRYVVKSRKPRCVGKFPPTQQRGT